ncbi:hypothetical protein KNLIENLN_00073 [Sinorhizobium phage NV1.1.1]|nr:hypothetical protein KNLIENLN_00073 [Sinorhizobium phage NV1.1.1]
MSLQNRKFPTYSADNRLERARKHAAMADKQIDLKGKRVLEVGCHLGDTTKVLADEYGCDVVGLDIRPQANWPELNKHPRITVFDGDITQPHELLADNSFDAIVSFVVWEHIRHPWSALQTCQRVLKPTGKKFMRANLERSALASHLYRHISEPWPQLIYSPREIAEKLNVEKLDVAFWCNKLTYQQYLFYFRKLGFYVTYEAFDGIKFDREFYEKHEQQLGLYPEWDLKTDFFNVVLEFDQDHPKQAIPDPVYRLRT